MSVNQQTSFVRWTDTRQESTPNITMAGARHDTVAEASPEAIDSIVRDLDRYLSTPATITGEESSSTTLKCYLCNCCSQKSTEEAKPDIRPKVLKALDIHFHWDGMMGRTANVSEMVPMPLCRAPSTQVKLLDTAKPIILHVRARKGHEDEVYNHGLRLASACLPQEQPIQLHCFLGDAEIVARWQHWIPNTHMSFLGLVDSFNEYQKWGLQAVLRDRLLLETDSPY
ncbi:hypothetical protein PoB_005226800 [Plakobranchus ocellatus]|uniref:TatD n=1 Tax=Plakobranchus ocellatus TaxID=259542 RepID=A0AAV4C1H6_9GAST|nr:hypothetical protein PoB_005226800 [Plakobranchus ocellatus]